MYDTRSRKHTAQKTQRGFGFRTFLLLVVLALAGGYAFYQQNVWCKPGDQAGVHDFASVTVRNLEPVKATPEDFRYGEGCMINVGGLITVVDVSGPYILVEYSNSSGAQCPNGILFFVANEDFRAMQKADEEIKHEVLIEQKKRLIVEQFLDKNNKKKG